MASRVSGPNLVAFVSKQIGPSARQPRLEVRPLSGGLVSALVQHVCVHFTDHSGKDRTLDFVVKELVGSAIREASVYQELVPHEVGLAPALLAIERVSNRTYLYIERIDSRPVWPWRDTAIATRLLEKLVTLHERSFDSKAIDDTEFERDLESAAAATLIEASEFVRTTGDAQVRLGLPALRRLIEHLLETRRRLIEYGPLPASVIHGDVHPGNVVIRRRREASEPLLVDWARTRRGSPLEDVSSFVQWLAFWEYNAMRIHDSLLGSYLRNRGIRTPPSMELRDAYWMAGAIGCCSGALTYHLQVARDPHVSHRRRHTALRAARHCLRIIRRADRGSFATTGLRTRKLIVVPHGQSAVLPNHIRQTPSAGSELPPTADLFRTNLAWVGNIGVATSFVSRRSWRERTRPGTQRP